jgi:hypothetical protein
VALGLITHSQVSFGSTVRAAFVTVCRRCALRFKTNCFRASLRSHSSAGGGKALACFEPFKALGSCILLLSSLFKMGLAAFFRFLASFLVEQVIFADFEYSVAPTV